MLFLLRVLGGFPGAFALIAIFAGDVHIVQFIRSVISFRLGMIVVDLVVRPFSNWLFAIHALGLPTIRSLVFFQSLRFCLVTNVLASNRDRHAPQLSVPSRPFQT